MSVKVLHIGQAIGGLDIYIRNTCKYLPNDIEFVIVRGDADKSKPFLNRGEQLIREYQIPLYRKISFFNDTRAIWLAIKIVKTEKPDIIHAHSAKGGLVGRFVGLVTGTKTFYTPHAFSFLSTKSLFAQWIYRLVERSTRFNTIVLACSESERVMAISKVGYKDENAIVWSNSVPDIGKLGNLSAKSKESFICTIGRPSYQKNTSFLIDVIRKVVDEIPEFKVYILGVGHHSPELDLVKSKVDNLNLRDNVVLVPWVDQDEVFKYVRLSKFYISTARYEGLPLAVIESMSLGKAIIASNVPGNIDCVRNGTNGYVLALEETLFADKIIELWKNDKLLELYGKNSLEMFAQNFNIESRIGELYSIYQDI